MKLRNIVVDDAIVTRLEGSKRNEVLAELMDSLVNAGAVSPDHRDTFLEGAIKREKRGTTGFGHGVAVPHVKTPDVDSLKIAIGISESGIDFKAFDKQPVHSIFLLVSPEERPEEHIDAMEAIFTCLGRDQFRRFLRQAESAQDVLTLIDEADAVQAG
ncbi:MAG: PTS fructose transporter subunit IIA [Phycisphaerae bacterium]|nr:PTS fructose transporter subunit IIA [Phycisphaerae bacterium]